MANKALQAGIEQLYQDVKDIIETSRATAYKAVNTSMVDGYWNIGKRIVEEEQKGEERAEYGTALLKALSMRLGKEYGKGFDESNLRNMRLLYRSYPKQDAMRPELSWTHYRLLMRVEKEYARQFYMEEAISCNWNTRTLERQINSLYYERMLMSGKEGRPAVKQEAEDKKEIMQPAGIIKDPYVLEFLTLKSNTEFYERELEQAIIDKLQEFLLELGKGFCFMSRQYRITAEDSSKHFHIDLVFYNYILKCF